jgi:Flp pilus assembly protein TadG
MRHERGEVSAESVIIVPIVFFVLLLGVQATTLFHAANIATAAAAQGASAAAASGASELDGERVASISVAELGGSLSSPPKVDLRSDWVAVTVRISVPQIIPGFPRVIERNVIERKERFVGELDR